MLPSDRASADSRLLAASYSTVLASHGHACLFACRRGRLRNHPLVSVWSSFRDSRQIARQKSVRSETVYSTRDSRARRSDYCLIDGPTLSLRLAPIVRVLGRMCTVSGCLRLRRSESPVLFRTNDLSSLPISRVRIGSQYPVDFVVFSGVVP